MIARIWNGTVSVPKAGEYLEYCLQTGVPDLRATEGNQGVYLLRCMRDDKADFLLISLWESFNAIEQFSGPQVERARYYPRDEDFLDKLEPTVRHYEVMAGQGPGWHESLEHTNGGQRAGPCGVAKVAHARKASSASSPASSSVVIPSRQRAFGAKRR